MKSKNNNDIIIQDSVELLFKWLKKNGYEGWDPYDGINSKLVKKLCMGSSFLEILWSQLNVYSLLNLRHIAKIKSGKDIKGCALFIQAYANLYHLTNEIRYKKELEVLSSFIKKKTLKKLYNFDCWSSHYFPYISIDKNKYMPNTPDIIGTTQVLIALVKSYRILDDKDLKEMIYSGVSFLIDNLLEKNNDDFFFKYYLLPDQGTTVFNASAQGLECLSYVLDFNKNEELRIIGEKIAKFLIKNQKKDGSWAYSIRNNGKERMQLDFHQGYIVDGLLSFLSHSNNTYPIINCINKGVQFYKNKLFLENGQSYYRYPISYPIDIHNQAQGIITFSRLRVINPKYLDFAKIITNWTISNMQDHSGYFYHQKWPIFTNKIAYMRWGQAWMMNALSEYLGQSQKEILMND